MVEIAKYNCNDSTEARIKENEHYNQLKATLNSFPPYVDKNNYFCSTCNLQCSSPTQYETHLKCVKHNNLKEIKDSVFLSLPLHDRQRKKIKKRLM